MVQVPVQHSLIYSYFVSFWPEFAPFPPQLHAYMPMHVFCVHKGAPMFGVQERSSYDARIYQRFSQSK